jgi:tRNA A-37 threonylcarbamoyl transferase component Bud32
VDPTAPTECAQAVAVAREEPALRRGSSLGRYVVLDRLGGGGMGVVYTAYDPELDRKVAVKLLRPEPGADDSEGRARLQREAQAMARLQHPNVIAVHDVGTFEWQVFIAMEFVDGVTLRRWRDGRAWREVLARYLDAGRGLAAAHAAGLVHRDFKPDNVLVGHDGRVRVLDFGLARATEPMSPSLSSDAIDLATTLVSSDRALETPLTRTGAFIGTPAYMAPEQLLRSGASDARTDQFGFCIALYEAIYGERPFAAATVEALAFEVAQGNVRAAPPSSQVPAWLRAALLRGLSVRPDERFPSMDALLDTLSHEEREEKARAQAAERELARQKLDADLRVNARARGIVIGVLGVLLAGIVVRQLIRQPTPTQPPTMLAFGLFTLGTVVVLGSGIWLTRRWLLANRASRQIVISLGVLYYGSLLTSFVGMRLGLTEVQLTLMNASWGAVGAILLGINLTRVFLWMGFAVLGFVAAAMLVPAHAIPIAQLGMLSALMLPVGAWVGKKT